MIPSAFFIFFLSNVPDFVRGEPVTALRGFNQKVLSPSSLSNRSITSLDSSSPSELPNSGP